MTLSDFWGVTPLAIITVGILAVLIWGGISPGRHLQHVAAATLLAAALWALPTPPPVQAVPYFGMSWTLFSRLFTFLFSVTGLLTLILSTDFNDRRGIRGEEYPAAVLFAVFGMIALVEATNLLVLFLAIEALTFAFYILVAIDLRREQSAEAGLKYLLQGAVAAAFIAFGIALIYAGAGTLGIADAMKVPSASGEGRMLFVAGWGFLLSGLAFKVSLVPAHLWTPDVYQGAPAPVVAFLSTGSKGAAFAALLMLMTAESSAILRTPLWWLALLSMVVGNVAALMQDNLKRMLAYSSIAQMGYITVAFLTGTGAGRKAVVFYIIAYTAMNMAAFGTIASLTRNGASDELTNFRGAGYTRRFQGAVLALAMFALAGIPPTAGFFGKFVIFSAAIRGGEWALAVIGILTAAISAYFYLRVVVTLYMHPEEPGAALDGATLSEGVVLVSSAMIILLLGIFPGRLLTLLGSAIR